MRNGNIANVMAEIQNSQINWLPIIIFIIFSSIAIIAGFSWQYIGNDIFKSKVDNCFKQILAKSTKYIIDYYYIVIFVLSILCFLALFKFTIVPVYSSGLLAYGFFVTVNIICLIKKRKHISSVISCRLGDKNSESGGDGLIYVRHEDGDAKEVTINIERVRKTNIAGRSYYIYFRIKEDVVHHFQNGNVVIIVEYFDIKSDIEFDLQYDSIDKAHPDQRYKAAGPLKYSGTNRWKMGLFYIKDARFEKQQNGASDFRLRLSTAPRRSFADLADLIVRRVICISLIE